MSFPDASSGSRVKKDSRHIRINQALHDDGHRQAGFVNALLHAIGTSAIGMQRAPTALDCLAEILFAFDAKDGFLLARKAGDGAVFRSRRRADRHDPAANCAIRMS